MPVRAGWVPCVGIQPPKPMVLHIDEADAIAEECERAFQHCPPSANASVPVKFGSAGEGGEGQEEVHTLKHPPAKPPMKLLMNPKGVQDYHAVQEHYQALMDAVVPTSPEVIGKIVTEVQSPTGKGAELFAKRKKRMDKFIVDETTVQKSHTTTNATSRTQQHQTSPSTNDLSMRKSAVEERNKQQHQIMEQFLRDREQSLTLVKSPWQATMETGTPDAAFDDKRQRIKLANTVVERADNKLAEVASWLELPKAVPLMESSLTPDVTAMSSVPRSMLSPANDTSSKRNSVNFNLAAKGWGTYNKFYSPVSFST